MLKITKNLYLPMALVGREREGKEVEKIRKKVLSGWRSRQPLGGAREPPFPPGPSPSLPCNSERRTQPPVCPLCLLLHKNQRPLPPGNSVCKCRCLLGSVLSACLK